MGVHGLSVDRAQEISFLTAGASLAQNHRVYRSSGGNSGTDVSRRIPEWDRVVSGVSCSPRRMRQARALHRVIFRTQAGCPYSSSRKSGSSTLKPFFELLNFS